MIKEIIGIYKRREKAHKELLKCDLALDKILKQHHKALEKQNNNFIEEVEKEEEFIVDVELSASWYLYHYDEQFRTFTTCKEEVKQYVVKKMKQAQVKEREELKKEIVEMITTYWQKQGDMIWPTDLIDKINNI